jgi:drug/metabolite transporter (DMT)-like permease
VRLPAGVAGTLLLAAVSGRVRPWARELARPRLLAAIAVSAFVGTYLGLWLSHVALGRASSAAVASTLIATSPLFALPLGRVLSAERITLRATLGSALACAGLAGLMLGRPSPPQPPSPDVPSEEGGAGKRGSSEPPSSEEGTRARGTRALGPPSGEGPGVRV